MVKIATRFAFLLFLIVGISCSNSSQFQLAKNQVGPLNSKTAMHEIKNLFAKDSVVKILSEGILGYRGAYSQEDDVYLVYAKGGKHLLTITPREPLDSLSTIRNVAVHDANYITENGIGLNSVFSEINLMSRITKTEVTFTKAILFLDDLNATMTLNKSDLGIKTIRLEPIQLEQIPDAVKPQSFVIWFD